MKILQVEKVVKRYGNFEAVKGISLSLDSGKTLAVLGPNGAGKSTTLKMIYATTAITSGKIFINGIDIVKQPRLAKRTIGVVMQDDLLDTTLTVKENMIAHGILFDLTVKVAAEKSRAIVKVCWVVSLPK